MESIFFDGPEGQLEGLLVLKESRMGAVLCHPHPLYGGSMHDTLLGSLHTAIAGQNCTTLRFNFRGVGSSDGDHDKGYGEVSDLVAAVDYLHSKGSGEIILAGYSFGAAMCLKAESIVKPVAMVLVAPPVQMLEEFVEPRAPCLVLLGKEDQIVPVEPTSRCFTNYQVELIDDADHFFYGAHSKIESLVSEKVVSLWN